MSRKRDRIAKKDPRNSSYITYSTKEMLGPLYYKGIAGISSMRAMTEAFNNEQVTRNLYQFMDGKEKEYGSITKLMGFRIPHIINSAHINEF